MKPALLVGAILLAAGAIASWFMARSLSSLETRLSALDAGMRQRQDKETAARQESVRALDAKLTAAIANVEPLRLQPWQQLKLDNIVSGLATEIARTQLVVVEQKGFGRLQTLVFGRYILGFERNIIVPWGSRGGDRGSWWVAFSESVAGTEKVKKLLRDGGAEYVCMKGVLSAPGRFGHLGMSERVFYVTEVLGVGIHAGPACGRPSGK